MHRGTTPLAVEAVEAVAGEYRIELFKDGWRDATRIVQTPAPTRIVVPLERLPSRQAWYWPTIIGGVVLFLGTCAALTTLAMFPFIGSNG